jgi:transposase
VIKPPMPRPEPRWRPPIWTTREILNAIVSVLRGGIAWRMRPEDLPPRSTTFGSFSRWCHTGLFGRINHHLVMANRARVGREASPSAAALDSRAGKTTECGGPRGYDAVKKVRGQERQALVDGCAGADAGGPDPQAADRSDAAAFRGGCDQGSRQAVAGVPTERGLAIRQGSRISVAARRPRRLARPRVPPMDELQPVRDVAERIGSAAHAHTWGPRCRRRKHASGASDFNPAGKLVQWIGDVLTGVESAAEEASRRAPTDRETRLSMLAVTTIENGGFDATEAFARELPAHVEAVREGRRSALPLRFLVAVCSATVGPSGGLY